MGKYTIHEDLIKAVSLPGRDHKMIIGPQKFGSSQNMCFGVAEFPARTHAPGHVHQNEEEIIYIISGKGEMYFDGVPEELKPGVCVYVPSGVVHSINNTSNSILKMAYVFSPPVEQGSYDKN